jgi:hypothetical protein
MGNELTECNRIADPSITPDLACMPNTSKAFHDEYQAITSPNAIYWAAKMAKNGEQDIAQVKLGAAADFIYHTMLVSDNLMQHPPHRLLKGQLKLPSTISKTFVIQLQPT